MAPDRGVSSLAIDLTRLHRRTVTSFYSNLVTRPTGRAVRMGLESQLIDLKAATGLCVSVLDFRQVRVLDYSCADEIVAKLLLRYLQADRPTNAYFLARGLRDHHRDAVEAVLEHHDLRLVAEGDDGTLELLGPADPLERACWSALKRLSRAGAAGVAAAASVSPDAAAVSLAALAARRVVIPLPDSLYLALAALPPAE